MRLREVSFAGARWLRISLVVLLAAVSVSGVQAGVEPLVVEQVGAVDITRDIDEDLRLAADSVRIRSHIGGNVAITANRVMIAPEARIDGRLWVLADDAAIEGVVRREVEIAGRQVLFNGDAGSDVRLTGDQVSIGPDATVSGRLVYVSPQPADIAPDAQIGGPIEAQGGAEVIRHSVLDNDRGGFDLGTAALILIAVAIATLAFPAALRRVRVAGLRDPLRTAGTGLLVLLGMPLFAFLLAITVIGLPLALLVLLLYALALVVGVVAAAGILGDWLLDKIWPRSAPGPAWRLLAAVIGSLALWLIISVPIVGPLVAIAAVMFGIGGTILAIYARLDLGGPDVIDVVPERR